MSDKFTCLYLTRSGLKHVQANDEPEHVSPDNCYTEDFIDRLNDHHFVGFSDYSNEIFLYHYVRLMELCEVLRSSDCSRSSFFAQFLDKVFFLRAKSISHHKVFFVSRALRFSRVLVEFLFSVIAIFFLSFFLPFYLIRRKKSDSSLKYDAKRKFVFLIRSKAAYQRSRVRIEKFISALTLVDNYGGLDVPGCSIYSVINCKNIFKIAVKSAFYALRDIWGFFKDSNMMLGAACSLALFPGYIKKIAHKSVYEACLNEVIYLSPGAVFFTGDKEDRFALLQTRICKREKKSLFCLPHGLEYGFRFPGGLAATTFYCFTSEAAEFLNDLYHETKFVYSELVTDEMFGADFEKQAERKVERVCFFTEPRDPEINYEIVKELMGKNIRFSLKLHPLESSGDYRKRFPEIEQVNDFNDAICSTVCLARKSTVLLEASQRGSKAIALLVNEKDRTYVMKIFPSLCSKSILRAFTFNELQEFL
ncbi:hypothetical protein [Marinobacter salarius]|uniref:hypothetical protein n=1 Tax=Marinobacter salarius TaxID=1420917 RepID=UPI0030080720